MAPPKDIARSYPKRGLTADVGFRSEPKFCGDGSIQLDGSNQYLNAELSSALGDSFTIMGWAKREGTSPTLDYIVNAGGISGAGNAISISITNNDPGILYFFDNGTSVNTSNTVDFNEWFHFALTVAPGAGNVKLYKNGIDGTPSNSVAVDLSDVTFEVGRYLGNSHYLQGKLFDLRVYDETLTQDQIRELLNNPGQTVPTGLTSADLIHRYLFETDTNDSGATGNNLTANNSPTFGVDRAQLPRGLDLARGAAQARCFTGRAVDLDGSTDFLDMGLGVDKNYTTRSDRASFSVWFNADQTASVAFLYQNRHNNIGGTDRPECETQLFSSSTHLFFDGEGASVSVPIANVTIGKWHHFVGIADDSDGPVKVYLDGVLYDTTGLAQAGANGNNFVIGARNNSPLQPFNGKLSNFKIFNVELTQAQVRELYHNPEMVIPTGVSASNLRRHYPLCAYNDLGGMGGRYEIDQGVEGVNGEYGGSPVMDFAQPVPCPQLGLQQSATRLYFPGATTQTSATIPALGATASISAWFFWDDAARVSYVASVGDAGSNTNGLNIRINTSGDVTTNLNGQFDSGLNVTEGTWNHIVVTTQSSSPYWKCFVNNAEASSPAALTGAINITATNAEIGANNFSFGAAGIIADAAIWTSELSDSNVAALYNSGVMGADVSQVDSSNLIAWWKCDDLTSCKDFSGNGRSMTITTALDAVSFPENASGSTIVGDFSLKRKGVSVLNPSLTGATTLGGSTVACQIPNDGTFDLNASKGFSFSGFLRNERIASTSNLFSTTNYNTTSKRLTLGNLGGVLQFRFPDSGGTARTVNFSPFTPTEGWHQYAVTMDFSSNTVKLFIDGALNVTNTSYTLGTITGVGDIIIGSSRPGGPFAEGAVAAPKFFDVTLSENEIEQIYHADVRLIKGLDNE